MAIRDPSCRVGESDVPRVDIDHVYAVRLQGTQDRLDFTPARAELLFFLRASRP
jgi:hypothetical protein